MVKRNLTTNKILNQSAQILHLMKQLFMSLGGWVEGGGIWFANHGRYLKTYLAVCDEQFSYFAVTCNFNIFPTVCYLVLLCDNVLSSASRLIILYLIAST